MSVPGLCEFAPQGDAFVCAHCGCVRRQKTVRYCGTPSPASPRSVQAVKTSGQHRRRCRHRGKATNQVVRVYGQGCAREQRDGILIQLNECALHGLCARLGVPRDESLRHCHGCRDFEPHQGGPHQGGQALLQ